MNTAKYVPRYYILNFDVRSGNYFGNNLIP